MSRDILPNAFKKVLKRFLVGILNLFTGVEKMLYIFYLS